MNAVRTVESLRLQEEKARVKKSPERVGVRPGSTEKKRIEKRRRIYDRRFMVSAAKTTLPLSMTTALRPPSSSTRPAFQARIQCFSA